MLGKCRSVLRKGRWRWACHLWQANDTRVTVFHIFRCEQWKKEYKLPWHWHQHCSGEAWLIVERFSTTSIGCRFAGSVCNPELCWFPFPPHHHHIGKHKLYPVVCCWFKCHTVPAQGKALKKFLNFRWPLFLPPRFKVWLPASTAHYIFSLTSVTSHGHLLYWLLQLPSFWYPTSHHKLHPPSIISLLSPAAGQIPHSVQNPTFWHSRPSITSPSPHTCPTSSCCNPLPYLQIFFISSPCFPSRLTFSRSAPHHRNTGVCSQHRLHLCF